MHKSRDDESMVNMFVGKKHLSFQCQSESSTKLFYVR